MNNFQLSLALMNALDPILRPLGFKILEEGDGRVYRKITPFGFNDISLLIWLYGDVSYISLGFLIRIDSLNSVFIPFSDYVKHEKDETITISADIQTLGYEQGSKIEVRDTNDLEKGIQILKGILVNNGLPFFDHFNSISSIDRELNRENRPRNLYCSEIRHRPFIGITAAALNRNPQFSYWENFYREKLRDGMVKDKENFEGLVKHLKGSN